MAWKQMAAHTVRRRRRVTLGVLGAVLVTGASSWIVYGTAAFEVTTVEVRGATFTEVADVREAAAIPPGASLAAVDADEVAERVAGVSAVEKVEVSRDWPHTVVVDITERSPLLAVPDGKKFILVDASGVAYRTVPQVPADAVTAVIDEPGRTDPATAAALTVLSSLTTILEKALVKVDATSATRITLELNDSRTVFWGDASHSDRKADVATALLARPEQHFDVSAPDVPTVS